MHALHHGISSSPAPQLTPLVTRWLEPAHGVSCRVAGIASLLYQTDIQPKTTLTHTLQFDATNLNAAPKFGLALSVKP
jgi:hypothetical protein